MFLLMFVSALFLGRGYCGWVCPGAGCQEAIIAARDKSVKKGDYVKWILWVPWICAIAFLAVKAGGYNKIDFLYQTAYGISVSNINSLIAYLVVLLLLIVLPAYIFGKRSFCHHFCWMAPFMILGRKTRNIFQWPSLRLTAVPENCTHCHTCTQNCPMSLPVEDMGLKNTLENTECILCGSCIDGCEFDVIKFAFFNKVSSS
ncbi:MAG: 4Fe-4S binding protein [Deltaproteobacteria bacterium]|nr:4Fe-4S binding protein [Deltaproteobacteria bacterium]